MKATSYNEWDPLLEVIVGSVKGAHKMGFEPSLGAHFSIESEQRAFTGGTFSAEELEAPERQLDGLARLLEGRGIAVRRPEPFPATFRSATPDFAVAFGNSYACPRDVLLVVGDTIVEAAMSQRGRYFEYRGYRKILLDHFAGGGRWLAAPKPFLDDACFAPDYHTGDVPYHPVDHPVLTTADICFDAACFTRCGRDIFWQPDVVSNEQGAEWLRRALGPDYRVHRVEFSDSHPEHIDTTLVPLRPKLAMINPERPPAPYVRDFFARNDWRLVEPPPSVRAGRPQPTAGISNWISLNMLVLDPETVVIEAAEAPLADFLAKLSFNVIGAPFDAVYKFGGAFHCCTSDLRRDGRLQSYFAD